MVKPKIFIVHCERNILPAIYVSDIIRLIGCDPILAEKEPKFGRDVKTHVRVERKDCDYIIIIATPDNDEDGVKVPSSSVTTEIGNIQSDEQFKGRFILLKDKSVNLTSMVPEIYYPFSENDYAELTKGLLLELGASGLFKNLYELPQGSQQVEEMADILERLKEWKEKQHISPEKYSEMVKETVTRFTERFTNGGRQNG